MGGPCFLLCGCLARLSRETEAAVPAIPCGCSLETVYIAQSRLGSPGLCLPEPSLETSPLFAG